MASDNITASFGGEQLGRFNTPEFDEDSTEVKNKPISSAQQAFEVFTRLQRDNQARANRNKLITDQYGGAAPFDQKKLDANSVRAGALISAPLSWPRSLTGSLRVSLMRSTG